MNAVLDIAVIQSQLAWENPIQNRSLFEQKIESFIKKVDVIILPEMFTTGFTMNTSHVAEKMDGETVLWMKKIAKKNNCAIAGSLIIEEHGNYYNRLLCIDENNAVQSYDKHHLFTMAKEDTVFTAGQNEAIINYRGWKIKPQICYDLRFPIWARNTSDYDVLLYVASWPKIRINAWDSLLKARAIENMCYCIGANRIGSDGNGYEHNGHSGVYDALGNSILTSDETESESIFYATLHKNHIEKTRKELPFLKDADQFKLL